MLYRVSLAMESLIEGSDAQALFRLLVRVIDLKVLQENIDSNYGTYLRYFRQNDTTAYYVEEIFNNYDLDD